MGLGVTWYVAEGIKELTIGGHQRYTKPHVSITSLLLSVESGPAALAHGAFLYVCQGTPSGGRRRRGLFRILF